MTPDGRMLPGERRDLEWAVWPGPKPISLPAHVAIRKVELEAVKKPTVELVKEDYFCVMCSRNVRVGDFPECPHFPPR